MRQVIVRPGEVAGGSSSASVVRRRHEIHAMRKSEPVPRIFDGRQGASRAVSALLFALLVLSLWAVGTVIHEVGHGLTGEFLGLDIAVIHIYPGLEIYPHFGQLSGGPDYHRFGSIAFSGGPAHGPAGLIDLMGSGSTLMVALAAHALLWRFKPRRRLLRYALIVFALYYLDMVTYTLNPALGLPRAVLFGTHTYSAEPLRGAVALGIPAWLFYGFNVVILVGLTGSLVAFVTRVPGRVTAVA